MANLINTIRAMNAPKPMAEAVEIVESHFKAGDTVLWKGMKGSVVSSTGEGDDEVYTVKCEDGKTYKVPARQLEGGPNTVKEEIELEEDAIDDLIARYKKTGRTATRYPKKKMISVDGRGMSEKDAVAKMKGVVKEEIEIDVDDELWEQFISELNEEGVQLDELDWQGIKDRYSKFYGGLGDKIANSKPVSAVSNVASKIKDRYSKFYGGIGDKSISDTLPKTTSQVKAIGKFAGSAADAAGDAISKAVDVVKPYANKGFDKLKAYVNKPRPAAPTKPEPSEPSSANSAQDLETKKKFAGAKADWTGPGKGVASKTDTLSKPDWKGPGRGVAEEVELDEARVTKDNVSKLLVKYGNNPKTVKQMVDKEFDRAVKAHPTATAAKIADVIRVTAESVELDEAAMVSTDALNRAVTSKFSPKVSAQVMGYLKPGTKKQVSVKDASAAMTKMNMSPRQIANVMSALNEEVEEAYGPKAKPLPPAEAVKRERERKAKLIAKGGEPNPGKWSHPKNEEVEINEAPLVSKRVDAHTHLLAMVKDYIGKASDSDLQKLGKMIGKKITIQGKKVVIEGVEINLDEEINMTIKTVEEAKRYGLTQSLLDAVKGVLKGDEQQDDGEGLDKVDPKQAKGKFADRKDKDINNDGKSDSTDKYLHARRKAVTKAVEKDEDKAQTEKKNEAKSAKDVAKGKGTAKQEPVEVNPQMEAAGCKTMKEAEMTDAQMKKREEIVKSMKKSKGDFEKRYGDRAKAVMYATATKMAMKEGFEFESAEAFFEAADIPFDGPYKKVKRNVKDKSGAVHTPMSRAKDLAKKAMKKEEVEIDEAGEVKTRNKTKKNRMDTARGDLYNKRNKLNIGPGDTGHATRQQSMKALGRALRNEEQIGSGKRTDSSDVANQADAVVKKSPQAGYNKPPAATMPYSTFMNSRPIGSKDKK